MAHMGYSYGYNNPVKYTDPSGHAPWEGDLDCAMTFTCAAYVLPATATAERYEAFARAAVPIVVETIASIALEPVDWVLTARDSIQFARDGDYWAAGATLVAGAIPLIPGSVGDDLVTAGRKLAGSGLVDDVADSAANLLHPLKNRADELHALLPPGKAQNMRTTAVVSAIDANGNEVILVASSRKSLDPLQRQALRPGEIPVSGTGHAEVTAIEYALNNGLTPLEVAASRPICPPCAEVINQHNVIPVSPLKKP